MSPTLILYIFSSEVFSARNHNSNDTLAFFTSDRVTGFTTINASKIQYLLEVVLYETVLSSYSSYNCTNHYNILNLFFVGQGDSAEEEGTMNKVSLM